MCWRQRNDDKKLYCMIKAQGNLHTHNTNHGRVNTKIATKKMPKVFLCTAAVKMSLRTTTYEAPVSGSKDENTKLLLILANTRP